MGTFYSMLDLEQRVGVPSRTLRFWIRKRLIGKPLGYGRGARYTEEHLQRATLVQRLRAQRQPLGRIANQIKALTAAEVAAQLGSVDPAPTTASIVLRPDPYSVLAARTKPPIEWHMRLLETGVVLMVNAAAPPDVQYRAEQVYLSYVRSAGR